MVFCPSGRSSNILATMGKELDELAATGAVSAQLLADTQNITLIKSRNAGSTPINPFTWAKTILGVLTAIMVLV